MPSTAPVDVLVVGGGISGAGVLRDAALRGLRALLVERAAFGGGTTGASSRLVHGGLRYLLYDRPTTHSTSWDSGHIVRTSGRLLRRLPIVWPVYRDHRHGIETVETLLEAYDAFQAMKLGRPHLRLTPGTVLALFPGLRAQGLLGGVAFDEWTVTPEALVGANVASALRAGGEALEGTSVEGFIREGPALRAAVVRTREGERRIPFRVAVNAAGPGVGEVARLAGARVAMRLRRGTHLVYRGRLFEAGLLLEAADRERYVFDLPFESETLVGPTDVEAGEGTKLAASPEEVRYLLDSARRHLPAFPERFDSLLCGARPILGQGGDESLLSRDHEVTDHGTEGAQGLVTLAGGKLSSYRLMAEDAVDLVCRKLGRPAPCRTHLEALDGSPVEGGTGHAPPPDALKTFLALHPRLRQAHALAHLGAGLARHWLRGRREVSDPDGFWGHYPDAVREPSAGPPSGAPAGAPGR